MSKGSSVYAAVRQSLGKGGGDADNQLAQRIAALQQREDQEIAQATQQVQRLIKADAQAIKDGIDKLRETSPQEAKQLLTELAMALRLASTNPRDARAALDKVASNATAAFQRIRQRQRAVQQHDLDGFDPHALPPQQNAVPQNDQVDQDDQTDPDEIQGANDNQLDDDNQAGDQLDDLDAILNQPSSFNIDDLDVDPDEVKFTEEEQRRLDEHAMKLLEEQRQRELEQEIAEMQQRAEQAEQKLTEEQAQSEKAQAEIFNKSESEQRTMLFGKKLDKASPERQQEGDAIIAGLTRLRDEADSNVRAKDAGEFIAQAKRLTKKVDSDVFKSDVTDCIDVVSKYKVGQEAEAAMRAELEKCQSGEDPNQVAADLEALKNRAKVCGDLAEQCNGLLRSDKQRRGKFLAAIRKFPSQTELDELKAELTEVKQAGAERAGTRMQTLKNQKPDDLKALKIDERLGLLEDLRFADESTAQAKKAKHEALAKVYKATAEAPAEFLAKEQKIRDAMQEELASDKIQNLRNNWKTKSPTERAQALTGLATAQCKKMAESLGIPIDEMPAPKVILTSDPNSGVSPERLKNMAGGFSALEGAIYLKDEKGSQMENDPDEALNTILHENTHNYQLKLVELLEAGRLKQGTDEEKAIYNQARLFQLNLSPGPGYLGGPPGYHEQPTEVHAHDAGDQVQMAPIKKDFDALVKQADAYKHARLDARITEWKNAVTTPLSAAPRNFKSAKIALENFRNAVPLLPAAKKLAEEMVAWGDVNDKDLSSTWGQFPPARITSFQYSIDMTRKQFEESRTELEVEKKAEAGKAKK